MSHLEDGVLTDWEVFGWKQSLRTNIDFLQTRNLPVTLTPEDAEVVTMYATTFQYGLMAYQDGQYRKEIGTSLINTWLTRQEPEDIRGLVGDLRFLLDQARRDGISDERRVINGGDVEADPRVISIRRAFVRALQQTVQGSLGSAERYLLAGWE